MSEDKDPNRPSSMTLMGGPIDTRRNPTAVNDFAETHDMDWFANNVLHTVPIGYPGHGRRVYPGFLQLSGFMSMNMDRHINAHLHYFRHLIRGDGDSAETHRDFYDEYLSVMDLPAEFYLDTIREVFKEHALPEGKLVLGGRLVAPEAITDVALMTVEGEKDDITGAGQTEAAHDLCRALPAALRKHYVQPKVGHYGIFNGRRWREDILPHVKAFLRAHDKGAAGRKTAA
jgi:poly(3-hydroxybutyrate) depolymerase